MTTVKATTSVKATKTKTQKKTVSAPVEEKSAPAPAPVVEPVVEVVVEAVVAAETATEGPTFRQRLEALVRSRMEHIDHLKREVQELRKLQREHDHMLKEASKKLKKKKAPRDYSKPKRATGFAEPVVVSDELYTFLTKNKATMKDPSFTPKSAEEDANWPRVPVKAGVPVARTDVTSYISKYIKEHNLQNPEMKREIVPDAALKKLFANPSEPTPKTYSYLQLQRYISHHFPKRVVKTEA
jgi:hypothetical protein